MKDRLYKYDGNKSSVIDTDIIISKPYDMANSTSFLAYIKEENGEKYIKTTSGLKYHITNDNAPHIDSFNDKYIVYTPDIFNSKEFIVINISDNKVLKLESDANEKTLNGDLLFLDIFMNNRSLNFKTNELKKYNTNLNNLRKYSFISVHPSNNNSYYAMLLDQNTFRVSKVK